MVEDFYRNKHTVRNEEDLYNLYKLSEEQRIEKWKKTLGLVNPGASSADIEPDTFCDWLVQRGICPYAIISANSRYHFENSVLMDSEMGLKMPDPQTSLSDTPAIFFQAISTVRAERAKVREEDGARNRNSNNG